MEAMGARFRSQGVQDNRVQEDIRRKTDRACQIVMMRLASGTVELSTLQTLCILSMLEFTGKSFLPITMPLLTSLAQRVISFAPGPTRDLLFILYETSEYGVLNPGVIWKMNVMSVSYVT